MAKYTELLLKAMILLMFFISLMRIRYLWKTNKIADKASDLLFRNRDGDWSILLFILLVMNKSRFDHYKLSFTPILRHFYLIIVIIFIVYSVLQLTQFVLLSKTTIISQEANIAYEEIQEVIVKRHLHGYKFNIKYLDQSKKKKHNFVASKKQKERIESRFIEENVNIV